MSLSVCLSVYLSLSLSVCVFVCLFVCMSVCLSVLIHILLSVYLSVCLSICLSVYLSISFIETQTLHCISNTKCKQATDTAFRPWMYIACKLCLHACGTAFRLHGNAWLSCHNTIQCAYADVYTHAIPYLRHLHSFSCAYMRWD